MGVVLKLPHQQFGTSVEVVLCCVASPDLRFTELVETKRIARTSLTFVFHYERIKLVNEVVVNELVSMTADYSDQSDGTYNSYSTGCLGFMAVNKPCPRASPSDSVSLLP